MMKAKNHFGLLIIAALTGLTVWLFLRGQSPAELLTALRGARPAFLLLGLLLMLVFVGCEALCSRMVLRRLEGRTLPYRNCLGYSFAGFYFSAVTPGASGGQPAQVHYMTCDGIAGAHGTLDMLLLSVCYQAGTLIYAIIALLLNRSLFPSLGRGMGLLIFINGALTLALTGGLLLVLFAPGIAAKLMAWFLRLRVRLHLARDPEAARQRAERQLAQYREGSAYLRQNPGLLLPLLAMTAVQLTALYLVPYTVYLALGLRGCSVWQIIGFQALLTIAVEMLPLPGAVGAAEGGFLRVFTMVFGGALVAPAMILSRVISFYSFLLLSGLVTLRLHLRCRRRGGGPALPAAQQPRPALTK